MSEPKWTPAQRAAIEDRGGALLVSAAAGSGKTAVLTERAVRLITDPEHPVDIDKLLVMTFTNAAAYEFTPEEGKSRLLEDKGEEKLFEITLPTTTPEEPVPVLVYKGPVPAGMEPCSAKAHSSREEAVTSAVVEVYCKGSFPYSVDTATCVVAPPLVSNDTSIKRTVGKSDELHPSSASSPREAS